jgi:ribosomal protein S27E
MTRYCPDCSHQLLTYDPADSPETHYACPNCEEGK